MKIILRVIVDRDQERGEASEGDVTKETKETKETKVVMSFGDGTGK